MNRRPPLDGLSDVHRLAERLDHPIIDAMAIQDAAALVEAARTVLRSTVHWAKYDYASWREIGDELGVTAQAAQQRFGAGLVADRAPRAEAGDPPVVDTEQPGVHGDP